MYHYRNNFESHFLQSVKSCILYLKISILSHCGQVFFDHIFYWILHISKSDIPFCFNTNLSYVGDTFIRALHNGIDSLFQILLSVN